MKRIDINPKDYPKGSVRRKAAQVVQEQTESEVNAIVDTVSAHDAAILDLMRRVRALEGTPSGELPADIVSKSTLVVFAQMTFPEELAAYSDDNRPFARKLRDALAARYPLIERVNDQEERYGYAAPDEKHSDAFYRLDTAEIIDFMTDADGPGRPIEKLGYNVNLITPW